MPQHDWNENYLAGDLPWDTGAPDEQLVQVVRSGAVAVGRALEVGCGTGTNSVWLAAQGFSVLGVDLAPRAIEMARARAAAGGVNCRFELRDFLRETVPDGPFDFVFDRGCFHVHDEHEDRARFAQRVAAVLDSGGCWLSLIGSTEGPERDSGPPRRSAREIVDAIEPALEIVELRSIEFDSIAPDRFAAWRCVARPRKTPAQPSTRRA